MQMLEHDEHMATLEPRATATVLSYSRHNESSALIRASVEELFDQVDDHAWLSSHMNRSSWMMGGGRMQTEVDHDG